MGMIIELLKGVIMGVVQGITEWLPISSTGHMILLNEFLAMDEAFFNVFKVVIQLGSILAVIVLYFNKLNPFTKKKTQTERKDTWNLWLKVAIASVPAAIVGFLLEDLIDTTFSSPFVIAATLIIYGIAFIIIENRNKKATINSFNDMNYKTALLIGAFQMLALIPGTSRSGATIVGAILLGTSRVVAAEFSFFMAIPVMVGASGYKMLKLFLGDQTLSSTEWAVLAVGFITAFVVSLIVIKALMAFIKKHTFKPFGYYRIVLGIVVIIYFVIKGVIA